MYIYYIRTSEALRSPLNVKAKLKLINYLSLSYKPLFYIFNLCTKSLMYFACVLSTDHMQLILL